MKIGPSLLLITLALSLGACDRARTVPDLSDTQFKQLAFTCVYEKDAIPARDPEADQLYKHTRWLRKNNLLKKDPLVYPKIERLIRISTAYGHDKANLELRQMIGLGTAQSEDIVKETLDLTEDLMKRGIPGGFYDMGRYLEQGYGVKQDEDLALKYYRKSADMGSPEGQYAVAELLSPIDNAPEIAHQMYRCAAEQGHGKAGLELGVDLKLNGSYPESLQVFQLGAKGGDSTSASFLMKGFNGTGQKDDMYYLGQPKDDERARRYDAIWNFLSDYSYLNPRVPEIDEIVPLPPAKLPPWDGKLQWLTEHEANVPPPLPSEERIREMAKAKHLDPESGRPLSGKKRAEAAVPAAVKAAVVPSVPLGTALASGSSCPQAGLWQCTASSVVGGDRRSFVAGEILPSVLVSAPRSLIQKLKGDPQNQLAATTWTLVGYTDSAKGA